MRSHALFYDDTVTFFSRRPTFSPDGSFLMTPTGLFKPDSPEVDDLVATLGCVISSSREGKGTAWAVLDSLKKRRGEGKGMRIACCS